MPVILQPELHKATSILLEKNKKNSLGGEGGEEAKHSFSGKDSFGAGGHIDATLQLSGPCRNMPMGWIYVLWRLL